MGREKVFIGISLVAGLVMAMSFYLYVGALKRKAHHKVEPTTRTQEWIVLKRDIPIRTELTADMLDTVNVPVSMAPPNAVTRVKDAVGRVAIAPMVKGQFLLSTHITAKTAGSDLGFVIPKGHRAITIETSATTGVGNMLKPGDRVDVVVFVDEKTTDMQGSFTLLRGLVVLATDQSIAGQKEDTDKKKAGLSATVDDSKKGYTSVTLAAKPDECDKINLAESIGTIRLVLQSPTQGVRDEYGADDRAVMRLTDLSPGFRKPSLKKEAPPPAKPGNAAPATQIKRDSIRETSSLSAFFHDRRQTDAATSTLIVESATATIGLPVYVIRGSEVSFETVNPMLREFLPAAREKRAK